MKKKTRKSKKEPNPQNLLKYLVMIDGITLDRISIQVKNSNFEIYEEKYYFTSNFEEIIDYRALIRCKKYYFPKKEKVWEVVSLDGISMIATGEKIEETYKNYKLDLESQKFSFRTIRVYIDSFKQKREWIEESKSLDFPFYENYLRIYSLKRKLKEYYPNVIAFLLKEGKMKIDEFDLDEFEEGEWISKKISLSFLLSLQINQEILKHSISKKRSESSIESCSFQDEIDIDESNNGEMIDECNINSDGDKKIKVFVRVNNENEGVGDYPFGCFESKEDVYEKELESILFLSPFFEWIKPFCWRTLVKNSRNDKIPSNNFERYSPSSKNEDSIDKNTLYVLMKEEEMGEIRGCSIEYPLICVEGNDLEKSKQYFPFCYYDLRNDLVILREILLFVDLLQLSASLLNPISVYVYSWLYTLYEFSIEKTGESTDEHFISVILDEKNTILSSFERAHFSRIFCETIHLSEDYLKEQSDYISLFNYCQIVKSKRGKYFEIEKLIYKYFPEGRAHMCQLSLYDCSLKELNKLNCAKLLDIHHNNIRYKRSEKENIEILVRSFFLGSYIASILVKEHNFGGMFSILFRSLDSLISEERSELDAPFLGDSISIKSYREINKSSKK
eukprot:TRINITY_DN4368_c0_g1_i1.p1 TRINITY_DN4368_c0_g1~~TRINITY_DN4368_c0_g1_i1.p1  ORF type:complete len:629 (-),score=139.75 TRINITY_DN4368_c0_g1_i1:25-1878(-)